MPKETINADEFDFSFDSFRPMGFTFTGIVESCKVENPKSETITFKDPRTGESVTRDAKPQLVMLVRPTDHTTKTGNPYPEYFPLTHNTRSKLGLAIQHFRDLGINLGGNPEQIVGMEFEFERKEVAFGGRDIQVLVPIALVDDVARANRSATSSASTPVARDPFADIDLGGLATVLDGESKDSALRKISGTSFAANPKLISAIVDGSVFDRLIVDGLLSLEGTTYVASRTPAAV